MGGSAGAMGTEANCDLFAGQILLFFFNLSYGTQEVISLLVRFFLCSYFPFTFIQVVSFLKLSMSYLGQILRKIPADRLHSERPDMDVRCISDSGTLYPFQDHTDFCFPQLLEYAAFEVSGHQANLKERK